MDWLGGCGTGVDVPVAAGVERFEGSSEENIVAEDGGMMYLLWMVYNNASLKPI